MKIYDVIIVGAGPSGISCAIQLSRYGIDFLLIEKERIGGLLINARRVENYPGFPRGIKGSRLVKRLKEHLRSAGVRVEFSEVKECEFMNDRFVVRTDDREYFSKILVLATGTSPRRISIKGMERIPDGRIFYEVYPISKIRGKSIAVIGSGDGAFDYALTLSRRNKVFILNRGTRIKALPLLIKEVNKVGSITYYEDTTPQEVMFDGRKILLICKRKEDTMRLEVDFILISIGRKPNIEILSENVIKNKEYLESIGRMYLIGDVRMGIYRQVAIACGDGILCAMKIYRRLKDEGDREDRE